MHTCVIMWWTKADIRCLPPSLWCVYTYAWGCICTRVWSRGGQSDVRCLSPTLSIFRHSIFRHSLTEGSSSAWLAGWLMNSAISTLPTLRLQVPVTSLFCHVCAGIRAQLLRVTWQGLCHLPSHPDHPLYSKGLLHWRPSWDWILLWEFFHSTEAACSSCALRCGQPQLRWARNAKYAQDLKTLCDFP